MHSSSEDGTSDCSEPESLEGLDYHWQQEALALTYCHLWRIDCQQLYATLRDKQPGVLLYMLRRLLHDEFEAAMGLCGCRTLDDIHPGLLA